MALVSGSVVGGGQFNRAREEGSTIAGGLKNQADGEMSTIGGGYLNRVTDRFGTEYLLEVGVEKGMSPLVHHHLLVFARDRLEELSRG